MTIRNGITSLDMNVLLDELGEGKRKPQEAEASWGSYRDRTRQRISDSVAEKAGVGDETFAEIKAANEEKDEKNFLEDFGKFFAKENSTATANQTNKFSLGTNSKTAEESRQKAADDIALDLGVEQDLLNKIAEEGKEKKGKDMFSEAFEHEIWETGADIMDTADMFVGKPLQVFGWEDNFISEWNNFLQEKTEEKYNDVMAAAERTGKGKTAENTAKVIMGSMDIASEAILSFLTAGMTSGLSLSSKGKKIFGIADDVGDAARGEKFFNNKDLVESLPYKNNKIDEEDILGTLKNAEGKTIIEVKHAPSKYKPGSILQVKNRKGGLDRNYYDDNGNFSKQISNNSHNHKKEEGFGIHGEHAHDHYVVNGKLRHGKARELTKEERKENADIL